MTPQHAFAPRGLRTESPSSDPGRARLTLALGLSLLLHGFLLSLRFGIAGLGLPGLELPWDERRARTPELQVRLAKVDHAPAAAAASAPAQASEPPAKANDAERAPPSTAAPVLANPVPTSTAPIIEARAEPPSGATPALKLLPPPVPQVAPVPEAPQPKRTGTNPKRSDAKVAHRRHRRKPLHAQPKPPVIAKSSSPQQTFAVPPSAPEATDQQASSDLKSPEAPEPPIAAEPVANEEAREQQLAAERSESLRQAEELATQLAAQQREEEASRQAQQLAAQQQAEDDARRVAAAQEAHRQAEEFAAAQRRQEEEAIRHAQQLERQQQAQEAERRLAMEQEARRQAEELARQQTAQQQQQQQREEEIRRAQQLQEQTEESARRLAMEQEARRHAEELAHRQAMQRQQEEEALRRAQQLEAQRQADEAAKRVALEQEARRQAEELARRQAMQRQQEEEAMRRAQQAQAEEQRARELEAQRQAQAQAARVAQEQAARRQAEEAARQGAEQAQRQLAQQGAGIPGADGSATRQTAVTAAAQPRESDVHPSKRTPADASGSSSTPEDTDNGPIVLSDDTMASMQVQQVRKIDVTRLNTQEAREMTDTPQQARRRSVFGSAEDDIVLKMYIDGWRRAVERNGNRENQAFPGQLRGDSVVTVAIRSDGSIESIAVDRASGLPELDAAVRQIIQSFERHDAFPPDLRRRYEVIEIRSRWRFDGRRHIVEDAR